VTSKLQVTIPKEIAVRYGIKPGVDITWLAAGDAIRVVPGSGQRRAADPARRLQLFDRATERQRERQAGRLGTHRPVDRGWSREELYDRGLPG
jgi:bifunctional DNA-binding transcriptional regulator/antitoxin component of YhaV-PrlF toxin-antitoxin module